MKKIVYVFWILILFTGFNIDVKASSGQLRKNSIVVCNGVTYGQHGDDDHWHVAVLRGDRYYPNGNAIYSNPCGSNSTYSNSNTNTTTTKTTTTTKKVITTTKQKEVITTTKSKYIKETIAIDGNKEIVIKKSDDNTLKKIIINNEEFSVREDLTYTTTKESIKVSAVTNDANATYEVIKDSILQIGNNKVIINVTAEDGSMKSYEFNILREKILSSDAGIKVIINGEEVLFENNKAVVYLGYSDTSYDFRYILNGENATVDVNKPKKIKTGTNNLIIEVTAENGEKQIYKVELYKSTMIDDIFALIVVIGIFGGFSYGIYYIIKKIYMKLRGGLNVK